MIPWEFIDKAQVPGNGGELRLYKRGKEFSIRVDGQELMNSSRHGSEDALAELVCDRIAGRAGVRVLVGGLGMGFTLAAALKRLGGDSKIVVAELVPEVIEWNRGPLSALAGNPVCDRRVTPLAADVAEIIRAGRRAYDAILLDIDNGPQGLTRKANDWLYSRNGLEAALHALRPGGVLAVWSATSDQGFAQRLRRAGFMVDEQSVRARGSSGGSRHTIWIASAGPQEHVGVLKKRVTMRKRRSAVSD
jgi:spermidine synthase